MEDVTSKLIDLASEHLIRASSLDAEIGADYIKYSAWCSALATGGIGLALSNWEKIAAGFPRPGVALGALIAALVVSIILGARINWVLNSYATACREIWSLVSIQRINLQIVPPEEKNWEFITKFWAGGYLVEKDQERWTRLRKQDADDTKLLLVLQQLAAVAGYGVAIGVTLWRYAHG